MPIGTLVYEKTDDPSEPLRLLGDLTDSESAGAGREGRPRRPRQRALRDVHQPRAAQSAAGRTGRREASAARAEAAGGRRAGRLSERRQVDAHLARLGGAPQDRRLSVHDADTESRRGRLERRSKLRRGRRAGPDRGRAPRPRPRPSVPAASRTHARCWSTWSTCRGERTRIPSRISTPSGASSSCFGRSSRPSRRSSPPTRSTPPPTMSAVQALAARAHALELPFFRISGVTGAGVPELLEAAWRQLAAVPRCARRSRRLPSPRPAHDSTHRHPRRHLRSDSPRTRGPRPRGAARASADGASVDDVARAAASARSPSPPRFTASRWWPWRSPVRTIGTRPTLELRRDAPSYTSATLQRLHERGHRRLICSSSSARTRSPRSRAGRTIPAILDQCALRRRLENGLAGDRDSRRFPELAVTHGRSAVRCGARVETR